MENRIRSFERVPRERKEHREPQPIGVILAELLAQYQARFPKVSVTVLETPTCAGVPPLLYQPEEHPTLS